jgi:hypothetical protein
MIAGLDDALAASGSNLDALLQFLDQVPSDQKAGADFVVAHMPAQDLQRVPAQLLLDNHAVAYRARAEAKWGQSYSDDIFFNDVLPYFVVSA